LAVHPHGGTAVETPDETARLFASTDPALVGYCLDSGHVVYGGGDVGKVAAELAHRVVYVHLKDYRQEVLAALRANAPRADTPTGRALSLTSLGVSFEAAARAHLFCPPGQGNLEFGPLLDALRAARYDGWYVVEAEQDPQLHDPYAAGAAAREFLTRRFGLG
jgi:inosose dehydratase